MVKVKTGPMGTQVSTVSSTVSSRTSALEGAIQSLNALAGTGDLKGAAYDGAKSYGTAILIPLVQALVLYSEALDADASKNQTMYAGYFSEDQDSAELEADISSFQSAKEAAQWTMRLYSEPGNKASKAEKAATKDSYNKASKALSDAQEKLRKLNEFNSRSAQNFTDIAGLQSAVMSGLSQVSGNFGSFSTSSGFSVFLSSTPDWVKQVGSEWDKRQQIREDYDATLKKIQESDDLTSEDIEKITRYAERFPSSKVPDYVVSLFEEYGINDVKEGYGKGYSYGDLVRNLLLTSRIKSKGNAVILDHGSNSIDEVLNKVFGLEKEFDSGRVQNGYDYSYITRKNGQKIRPKYRDMVEGYGIDTDAQLFNSGKTSLKGFGKTLQQSAKTGVKTGLKSGLSLGITDAVDAFQTGGKVAKGVALLNVVSAGIDVVNGTTETHNLALSKGIKAGSTDYYQAQAGGIGIDVAKGTATTVASVAAGSVAAAGVGAAAAALGVVSAPVWIPVAASVATGFIVTQAINKIDDSLKVTKTLKNLWTDFVKG